MQFTKMNYKLVSVKLAGKGGYSVPFNSWDDAKRALDDIISEAYENNQHARTSNGKTVIYTSLRDLEELRIERL